MTRTSTPTLISHGRVITASDDYVADVLMQDGVITAIGRQLTVGEDVAVVDATGLYVLPGGVDTHVHLENVIGPTITCDAFASGTKAAAFGGTTTIVDFALQTAADSPLGAIARAQRSAEAQVNIDYSLHCIVTRVDKQVLADVRHAMRHEGVTSFKMFMAYPGVMMADDAAIFQMLRQVGADGGMVALHAENGTVIDLLIQEALEAGHTSPRYHALTRPARIEGEATHRCIRLAELAEAPIYFVHVSSNQALKHIVAARDEGIPVFSETCPHYLLFDDSVYDNDDFETAKYVMTPPLRKPDDQKHLWRALRYDDLQVIATDHCPFCMKEGHRRRTRCRPARPARRQAPHQRLLGHAAGLHPAQPGRAHLAVCRRQHRPVRAVHADRRQLPGLRLRAGGRLLRHLVTAVLHRGFSLERQEMLRFRDAGGRRDRESGGGAGPMTCRAVAFARLLRAFRSSRFVGPQQPRSPRRVPHHRSEPLRLLFVRQVAQPGQRDEAGARHQGPHALRLLRRHGTVVGTDHQGQARAQAREVALQRAQVPLGHHAERAGGMAGAAQQSAIKLGTGRVQG